MIHDAQETATFKTEAQEAEWWAKNQSLIADSFEPAKAGKLGKGPWPYQILRPLDHALELRLRELAVIEVAARAMEAVYKV